MPALRLPELQIPELGLPEMSRDEVIRVIGDVRRDVDLGRLDPRRADLPQIELPKVDLTAIDLPGAITSAAESVGVVRATRRGRLPFVIGGLITLGIVGFALLTSPMVRPRLNTLGQKVRQRIDEARAGDGGDPREDEAHAFDAAVAAPTLSAAFSDAAPAEGSPFDGASDLPDGLGTEAEPVGDSAAMVAGSGRRPTA